MQELCTMLGLTQQIPIQPSQLCLLRSCVCALYAASAAYTSTGNALLLGIQLAGPHQSFGKLSTLVLPAGAACRLLR
jgi:hypothetical protein